MIVAGWRVGRPRRCAMPRAASDVTTGRAAGMDMIFMATTTHVNAATAGAAGTAS